VRQLIGDRTTESIVAHPHTAEQCREVIEWCRREGRTLAPRGAGHSYGDMPTNDGEVLLDTRRMNRILELDLDTGRMVVEPGVSILDVYQAAHPHLWMLPASPSEGTITVAGAIANNVNGKDGWRAGNFGDQVLGLKLLTADGRILELSREREPELFAAVNGGMGMLGVVVEATLQLARIETPYVQTSRVEAANVREMLRLLEATERESDFAVGWVDVYSHHRRRGRSVIHSTKWYPRPERADQYDRDVVKTLERLASSRHQVLLAHALLNVFTSAALHVQKLSVRVFNAMYFVFCTLRNRARVSQAELFVEYNFFPNLRIPPAQMVCGPHGYTVQVLFPREGAEQTITEMIRQVQGWPAPPVTTVLRVHKKDDMLLSFSEDGYSLNFEIHPKRRHVERMRACVDELVECTIRHGGKVHLAKDQVLKPEQFRRLFPRHAELLEIKRRLDPEGLFCCDLFRRLFPEAVARR
jgi:FAD/FMN-containing dehydrogenase